MPELTRTLLIGEVTDINESWSRDPKRPDARHCYGVTVDVDDMATVGQDFSALLRGLGLESKTTRGSISVEQPGLRISLVRTQGDRAMVLACWDRDAAAAEQGFAELLPEEPPLSSAAEIAAAHGGLEQVELGWSIERGRTLLVSGTVEPSKAESVAEWFADHGYGAVTTDGVPVQQAHADGLTSFAAVAMQYGGWVVEFVHAGAPSPFEVLEE